MAGVLEQLQQQIEDLTAAISKLSDRVKDLEQAGGLTRSPDAPDTKSSHCNEKPVRESGYVNWDESHDSIKYMGWIGVRAFNSCLSNGIHSLLGIQEHIITINENTRFPKEKNAMDNLYLNASHPEVVFELLYRGDPEISKMMISVKNHFHTRSSFEEKYKLRWVDPKERTPFKETETEIIKDEGSATESTKSSEIKEADQNIPDMEKNRQIIGKVITNNVDILTNHESMPSINSGENSNSNQNPCSMFETPEVCDNTKIILTEENPVTVDIMSIEQTLSQILLDTADVRVTQNTGDDLIAPLNSINDSLFKQDSSTSLTAPEDEAEGAKEDLSENEITSELKHEDEEDNKSLELLEKLPKLLDIITQSKSNHLVTELSALDLSHKKPLNIVVELFVDNYFDIMEELIKKKVEMFLQEVKTFEITTTEHFNILIDLLYEKLAEEPDLAHHFAYMCQLSDVKEFRSLLINKCQNYFETFVIDNNQDIYEEDHQMNRRCVGIVKFIGELYNKNIVTTTSINQCLRKLLEQSKEINLECTCELLITSGRNIKRQNSTELSKALKKIDELLSSKTNSNDICYRVKRMMQNTFDLSKRNWRTIPLPKTLDHIEKKSDRTRLLMKMLTCSTMENRENTNIWTRPYKHNVDRVASVASKPEKKLWRSISH